MARSQKSRFLSAFLAALLLPMNLFSCSGDLPQESKEPSESAEAQPESAPEQAGSASGAGQKTAAEVISPAKKSLRFREDGTFKILVLSDLHVNTPKADPGMLERIRLLVDREAPDLVFLDGDNTWDITSEKNLRSALDDMMGYIEEKEIPWAHVYGNHDDQNQSLSREEQQKIYESYEWCVSRDDDPSITGVGNFVLPVTAHDGDEIAAAVWGLDSGTYLPERLRAGLMPVEPLYHGYENSAYAAVAMDQILWYYRTSQELEQKCGRKIPGFMGFHIPLPECWNAWVNREGLDSWSGAKNEAICASELNTGLFAAILERGDVKTMVFGHDHVNDFMLDYCGVKLCASSTVSSTGYWNEEMAGARVVVLHEDGSDAYIYMSYIDESYGKEDAASAEPFAEETLLDFEDGVPANEVCGFHRFFDSGAYVDEIQVGIAEGCGWNGSGALSVTRTAFHGESGADNFEVYLDLGRSGALGDNAYLRVWMDLSGDGVPLDFRKACFGLVTNGRNASAYATDNYDEPSEFYFLGEGESEWRTFRHGNDGCFGAAQTSSVEGLKGWFAFPVEYMLSFGALNRLKETSVVTGVYFYGCLNSAEMAGGPILIDEIQLVKDYKTFG